MSSPQEMNRAELQAQLEQHEDKALRLWYFEDGESNPVELEFIEVKFEDDEIVVEMRKR